MLLTVTMLRRVWITVFLTLLLVPPPAQASTVRQVTFSEVIRDAEMITIGTVSAIEHVWDAQMAMPFTDVTFSLANILKGHAALRELKLRFLGGPSPDGLTLRVAGIPDFRVGEQVMTFSTGNGARPCPLVGWWQGLFRVVRDSETGMLTVADHAGHGVTAIDGVIGERNVLTASTSRRPTSRAPSARAPSANSLTLEEFMAAIREEL